MALTEMERIERLERVLEIGLRVNLEHFGVLPSASPAAQQPAADEDVPVVVEVAPVAR
jgi:hypothetical protein